MAEINKEIELKLKDYPENVQKLALYALEEAKRIDASSLAQLLETEVKKMAKKEVNR